MFLTATWHLDSFDKALKHISKQKPDVDLDVDLNVDLLF